MSKLTATFLSKYRSKNSGQLVYVYTVSSNQPDGLEKFAAAQGANLRKQEGTDIPLYFVTEYDANNVRRLFKSKLNLIITQNNRVVVDDQADEERKARVVEDYMLQEEAKQRVALMLQRQTRAVTATPTPAIAAPKELINEPVFDMAGGEGEDEGNENIADETIKN